MVALIFLVSAPLLLAFLAGASSANARGATPADARSLQREQAVQLLASIRAASGKPMSPEAKAHLAESQATLTEVLKASLVRAGV